MEDDYRICFLLEHISELKKAILEDRVDYIGYFTWSRVDAISLSIVYDFIYVDKQDDGSDDL
ncbi:MAG: family 1 glycosylhydrolase [Coprobacillus cateniformis]